ncbi:rCG22951, partial [Rattus norvegicus]
MADQFSSRERYETLTAILHATQSMGCSVGGYYPRNVLDDISGGVLESPAS